MKNTKEYINEKLKDSFDVKVREVDTALGRATAIFVDDLCGTVFISEYIVAPLKNIKSNVNSIDDIASKVLDINLVGYAKDNDDAVLHVLSGDVVIVFDNYTDKILFCEAKGYVRRGVGIPVAEAVLKGPREGFTEAFVDNVALIRRRVKDPNLKFEPIYVGKKSNTVVCLTYIKDTAPKKLVDNIRRQIKELDYEFILDTNYIENKLRDENTIFDTVGYTEKPDTVVAKLMEGRIAVIVDGTPFVLTAPYFFIESFQAQDDYYLNRYYANFTRIIRWLAFFFAAFLPGLYLAIVTYHFGVIPSLFVFRLAVSRAGVPFPTVVEVIVMMIFFQLIKEAGLRLPQPIGAAMSIVAGLILGDAAVGAGIASRITILVVAISSLSYFLIPRIYGAMSAWSLIIVIMSGFLGLPGFFVAVMVLFAHICNLKSCGYYYMFPVGTLKKLNLKDIILRGPLEEISNDFLSGDDTNEKSK
ncbi:spore germination protein [Clostridium manihotivorum]|uniref:Spore germination protein n=1 Tax=Clostridium manihotivorum TaxID=2320868 RepID=A0A3R5UIJ6_9CLOT|nr:spore germination protein [Clostridium manihotivorum]QAA34677.1 spore germination protein [Clostridium manihotivorum]